MNINLSKLSQEGLNLALMAINSSAGGQAANLILKKINSVQRIINLGRQEGKSDVDIQAEIDDLNKIYLLPDEEDQLDQGLDRPATAEDFMALFEATNEELSTRREESERKNWPIVGLISNVVDFKMKQAPRIPTDTQIQEFRMAVTALRGKEIAMALPDAEVKELLLQDNVERQEYFSSEFSTNRAEIEDQLHELAARFQANPQKPTWETLLNNFPPQTQISMLTSVDNRLESKMKELAYGRRANGELSKGATRPIAERISDIGQHKIDQAVVRSIRRELTDSGPEEQAPSTKSAGIPAKGAVPSAGPGLEFPAAPGTRKVSDTEFRGSRPHPATPEQLKKLVEQRAH